MSPPPPPPMRAHLRECVSLFLSAPSPPPQTPILPLSARPFYDKDMELGRRVEEKMKKNKEKKKAISDQMRRKKNPTTFLLPTSDL